MLSAVKILILHIVIFENDVLLIEIENYFYRVYHIEMDETKWLSGIERSIILLHYGAQWLWEIWTFEFQPSVFKKLRMRHGHPQLDVGSAKRVIICGFLLVKSCRFFTD